MGYLKLNLKCLKEKFLVGDKMPNPRYIDENGIPTKELLEKLKIAKETYHRNLCTFCNTYSFDINQLGDIESVFLIGSQATEEEWDDEKSDIDFKLVNSSAPINALYGYKRGTLNRKLLRGEKRDWIDFFFASGEQEVSHPRVDLTEYWMSVGRFF